MPSVTVAPAGTVPKLASVSFALKSATRSLTTSFNLILLVRGMILRRFLPLLLFIVAVAILEKMAFPQSVLSVPREVAVLPLEPRAFGRGAGLASGRGAGLLRGGHSRVSPPVAASASVSVRGSVRGGAGGRGRGAGLRGGHSSVALSKCGIVRGGHSRARSRASSRAPRSSLSATGGGVADEALPGRELNSPRSPVNGPRARKRRRLSDFLVYF